MIFFRSETKALKNPTPSDPDVLAQEIVAVRKRGRESFKLGREEQMKPNLSKILKALRAQRESIYDRRFANQSTPLDLMRLAKETLPNATSLTPEERVSINEFFGPTSNEPVRWVMAMILRPGSGRPACADLLARTRRQARRQGSGQLTYLLFLKMAAERT